MQVELFEGQSAVRGAWLPKWDRSGEFRDWHAVGEKPDTRPDLVGVEVMEVTFPKYAWRVMATGEIVPWGGVILGSREYR